MWKKIEPLVAGFWMGLLLAHNPTYVGVGAAFLVGALYGVRRIKAYLERRANLKFQAEEEAEKKLLDAEEADANYQGIVLKALEKLKAGSKPGWAVQAGVMALNRGDSETLQKLVNAAYDDIGLVTLLQERSGEKLGYLLGDF